MDKNLNSFYDFQYRRVLIACMWTRKLNSYTKICFFCPSHIQFCVGLLQQVTDLFCPGTLVTIIYFCCPGSVWVTIDLVSLLVCLCQKTCETNFHWFCVTCRSRLIHTDHFPIICLFLCQPVSLILPVSLDRWCVCPLEHSLLLDYKELGTNKCSQHVVSVWQSTQSVELETLACVCMAGTSTHLLWKLSFHMNISRHSQRDKLHQLWSSDWLGVHVKMPTVKQVGCS